MDFVASLVILPDETLEIMAERLGDAMGLRFIQDSSGYYEEFPAFTAHVLGMEFALLGLPEEEEQDGERSVEDYSLLVRSIVDTPDDVLEVDLSTHLQALLNLASIRCYVGTV
jgi:hypothetical protein